MFRHVPVLAAALGAALAFAFPPDAAPPVRTGPTCTGAVHHPVSARVVPLDPVRRGDVVRLRVEVATETPLEAVSVRVLDPGTGAGLAGPAAHVLGALAPGAKTSATFAVRVPERGHRTLVQFQVAGEGPAGTLLRGATYNILPDGPADPGRPATAADGAAIREYAAGRIQ